MSGVSDSCPCPNCGEDARIYTDWKPFDYSSISCIHCGLEINPKIEYLDLIDLNNERKEWDMPELEKLPIQDIIF